MKPANLTIIISGLIILTIIALVTAQSKSKPAGCPPCALSIQEAIDSPMVVGFAFVMKDTRDTSMIIWKREWQPRKESGSYWTLDRTGIEYNPETVVLVPLFHRDEPIDTSFLKSNY